MEVRDMRNSLKAHWLEWGRLSKWEISAKPRETSGDSQPDKRGEAVANANSTYCENKHNEPGKGSWKAG